MLGPFFAHMAVHPDQYGSGTFHACFQMAPPRAWGVLITALCLAVLVLERSWWPAAALATTLAAWSTGLALSYFGGWSQAPASWAFTGGAALLLVWGVGKGPR